MSTEAQRQAKQPVSAVLAGPYGHPVHPLPVTVPIGARAASPGFTGPARRTSVHRGRTTAGPVSAPGAGPVAAVPAERHLPVTDVLAHGQFAMAAVAPVLPGALGIGD